MKTCSTDGRVNMLNDQISLVLKPCCGVDGELMFLNKLCPMALAI